MRKVLRKGDEQDHFRNKGRSHDSNFSPIYVVKVFLGCQGSAHDWFCAEAWSQQIQTPWHVAGRDTCLVHQLRGLVLAAAAEEAEEGVAPEPW